MTLRRQLLIVSLLLLSLPWAGCQFVREMEATLQVGQEQSLLATTRAVATVLGDKPGLLYPTLQRWQDGGDTARQVYAHASVTPIIVDGYGDGWDGPPHQVFQRVDYRARTRGGRLFLLFTVSDDEVVYHNPQLKGPGSGDRLVLQAGNGRRYTIATAAPGRVQARYQGQDYRVHWETAIRGEWQDNLQGYSIELEMPLALLGGRLGFFLVNDSGEADTAIESWSGNMSPEDELAPWLIYTPTELEALVAPFSSSSVKLSVLDQHHWVVSRAGELQRDVSTPGETHWVLRGFYRAILSEDALPPLATPERTGARYDTEIALAMRGRSSAGWYGAPASGINAKTLLAASPIYSHGKISGVVMAEQNSEQYLSLTDRAFGRLLAYTLGALTLSAAGLLGYASILSWRIRRLTISTRAAVEVDGSINNILCPSKANDEIGELSRGYAELLGRISEYNDYLRGLSRKLSHELRTPIAMIQSSLDNLEQESTGGSVYLERSRDGLRRLRHILTAMSEANRLEESIHNQERGDFDLAALCRQMLLSYQALYPSNKWVWRAEPGPVSVTGSADLIAQMLDKLADNAASFTADGDAVTFSLARKEQGAELEVCNQGPGLPAAMRSQLFDSMVSIRERGDEPHLGLGLHVVKLIVEFHRGRITAENLEDGSGVRFRIWLPLSADD